MRAIPRSLVRLLDGLIDYAGLFPPAALSMPQAVRRYASHRHGTNAWALGRFVVPAGRLEELAAALDAVPRSSGEPWPLSVLADWPPGPAIDRARAFAASVPGVRLASVECRVATPEDLAALAEAAHGLETFAEVPLAPVPVDLVAAAAERKCAVKIRTGGTAPQAFPSPPDVAAFLAASLGRDVPFKATAGLHHPVRSAHPVSGEPGAERATMHGFLNLFLAAALVHAREAGPEEARQLLDESDPRAFAFEDGQAAWRGRRVTTSGIQAARRLARGFGSCSFDEPIDDLVALGLLPAAATTTTT